MNTHKQIANDWSKWTNLADPNGTVSRNEFDAMTEEDKIQILTDCFGPQDPREIIKKLADNDAAITWSNDMNADVDLETGDVWVNGYWAPDAMLVEFAEWLEVN
jgi:hypothetical protein